MSADIPPSAARRGRRGALIGLLGVDLLWPFATFYGLRLLGARPILYDATLPLLPADAAARWRTDWDRNAEFRRTLRRMTAAWGAAFLIDAAARVVMAYTLPVDVVPGASVGLLVVMLVAIVQITKAYARRRLPTFTDEHAALDGQVAATQSSTPTTPVHLEQASTSRGPAPE
ncbi:hypothetical protein [Nocardia australiensis]|uniref:hypothetical protein n=1 Tax=Nocardia australiensis TaxID=2887191 RepID=UPI001D15BB94|nr:hypothetical protein [Nocardia australiensis]